MRALEPWHLIVLVLVVAVLFGGKRLPDAARGLGRSMRIFKSEISEMGNDSKAKPSVPPAPPEVLEGRVVPEPAPQQQTAADQRRDV